MLNTANKSNDKQYTNRTQTGTVTTENRLRNCETYVHCTDESRRGSTCRIYDVAARCYNVMCAHIVHLWCFVCVRIVKMARIFQSFLNSSTTRVNRMHVHKPKRKQLLDTL